VRVVTPSEFNYICISQTLGHMVAPPDVKTVKPLEIILAVFLEYGAIGYD
jgi:hypothetical protein